METTNNSKFKYVIKATLKRLGCFKIRISELDEKFEDKNQLTLFTSNIRKPFKQSFTIDEVL